MPPPAMLQLAERAATAATVRLEAELACLQIARKLGADDFDAVEVTLTRLASSGSSAELRTEARTLLQALKRMPGGDSLP